MKKTAMIMAAAASCLWIPIATTNAAAKDSAAKEEGQSGDEKIRCRKIAVIGSLPDIPADCASDYLAGVPSAIVAAPEHPLAKARRALTRAEINKHVQLVLTDRSTLTAGREFGVMSQHVWRLADLGAKHAFLRAGLGWGSMPLHMVEQDLADGTLVRLSLRAHPLLGTAFSMHAIWLKDQPPGPAGRWFVDRLKCD